MAQQIHLNTLLDTMIMMLLDHYAWLAMLENLKITMTTNDHKWLAMLENLKVMQQCPLGLATSNCWKNIIKYGKELKNYCK